MTKKDHHKFLRMKIEIFFGEKVNFGKFSTESEKFSEIGGNPTQEEMHHCLGGSTPLGCSMKVRVFRTIMVLWGNMEMTNEAWVFKHPLANAKYVNCYNV